MPCPQESAGVVLSVASRWLPVFAHSQPGERSWRRSAPDHKGSHQTGLELRQRSIAPRLNCFDDCQRAISYWTITQGEIKVYQATSARVFARFGLSTHTPARCSLCGTSTQAKRKQSRCLEDSHCVMVADWKPSQGIMLPCPQRRLRRVPYLQQLQSPTTNTAPISLGVH